LIRQAAASAPGKIILSGEHFVVHGSLAVAAAIKKRVRVTVREIDSAARPRIVSGNIRSNFDLEDGSFVAVKTVVRNILAKSPKDERSFEVSVSSEIPAGSGLGSSAAVSVASVAALSRFLGLSLDRKTIFEEALAGERKVHGNPSGLDIQASISGGLILFDRKTGMKQISIPEPFSLVVIFSGKKRSTSRLISKVARREQKFPHYFAQLVKATSYISQEVVQAATSKDMDRLGSLFTAAQTQLSWINVSTPQLDDLIEKISEKNVFGSKLTGAGGGGSIIVSTRPEAIEVVLKSSLEHYPYSFITEIPQEGLRWEESKIS
jgi:mevalonate kinase